MQAEDYIRVIKAIKSNPRNFETFTKSSEKDKCNSLKVLSEAQLFLKYHLSELESRAFELKNKVRAKCGVSSVSSEKLNEVQEEHAKRMKIQALTNDNQALQERLLLLKSKRDAKLNERDVKPKNKEDSVKYVLHPSLGMDQRSNALLNQLKALQKEKQRLTKESKTKQSTFNFNEFGNQATISNTSQLFPELSEKLQALKEEVKRLTVEKENLESEEKDLKREIEFSNQKIDFYKSTVALVPENEALQREIEHLEAKVQTLEKQIRDTVGQTFSMIDNSANVEAKKRRLAKLNEQIADEKIRQSSLKEYMKIQDEKVTEAKKNLDRVMFENDTVDEQLKAAEAMINAPEYV